MIFECLEEPRTVEVYLAYPYIPRNFGSPSGATAEIFSGPGWSTDSSFIYMMHTTTRTPITFNINHESRTNALKKYRSFFGSLGFLQVSPIRFNPEADTIRFFRELPDDPNPFVQLRMISATGMDEVKHLEIDNMFWSEQCKAMFRASASKEGRNHETPFRYFHGLKSLKLTCKAPFGRFAVKKEDAAECEEEVRLHMEREKVLHPATLVPVVKCISFTRRVTPGVELDLSDFRSWDTYAEYMNWLVRHNAEVRRIAGS
jgi:hypothetical protein